MSIALRAPLTRVEQVAPLAAAGADEFYCGFTSPDALDGQPGANHRQGPWSNFVAEEELAEAIATSHGLGREISLTVNARSIADEDQFLEQVGRAVELGMDAVVVGNWLGLILAGQAIDEDGPRIHCGVNVGILNGEAARKAQAMGASRVTLSRHLSAGEIERIAEDVPALEFEVFALNGHCGYYDAYCGFHYDHVPEQAPDFESGCLYVADPRPPRYRRHACAACRVLEVMDHPNIVAAKLVGRDFDPDEVLRDVGFLRRLIESTPAMARKEGAPIARQLHDRHRRRPCSDECVRDD